MGVSAINDLLTYLLRHMKINMVLKHIFDWVKPHGFVYVLSELT